MRRLLPLLLTLAACVPAPARDDSVVEADSAVTLPRASVRSAAPRAASRTDTVYVGDTINWTHFSTPSSVADSRGSGRYVAQAAGIWMAVNRQSTRARGVFVRDTHYVVVVARPDTTKPPPDTAVTPPPPDTQPTPVPVPPAGLDTSGLTRITSRGFETKAKADTDRGPLGSQGWDGVEFRSPNIAVVADPTAPCSPPAVMRWTYPTGFVGGSSPGTAQTLEKSFRVGGASGTAFPREVAVSLCVRLSPNWWGEKSKTNKMFFLDETHQANAFVSAEGSLDSTLIFQLRLQGVADPRSRITTGVPVVRGRWQRWELRLACNSANGQADGRARVWIDGRLVLDKSDLDFTPMTNKGAGPPNPLGCMWTGFEGKPVYGGGKTVVPATQWLDMDHVIVWGR